MLSAARRSTVSGSLPTALTSLAIFVMGLVSISETTQGGSLAGTEGQLIETAIRQGGLLLVLVIVLFFYRRDYHYLTEFFKEQNDRLFEIVNNNTKALTDDAAATREMSIVMHQAKNVMAQMFPDRRRDEDLPGPRRPQ